ARLGKGLGLRFVQHVERTRLIAVLVPVDSPDPQATYELLLREAASYSPELASKPHIVVLTKADLTHPASPIPTIRTQGGAPVLAISAVTGAGVPELLETLWQALRAGGPIRPHCSSRGVTRRCSPVPRRGSWAAATTRPTAPRRRASSPPVWLAPEWSW